MNEGRRSYALSLSFIVVSWVENMTWPDISKSSYKAALSKYILRLRAHSRLLSILFISYLLAKFVIYQALGSEYELTTYIVISIRHVGWDDFFDYLNNMYVYA